MVTKLMGPLKKTFFAASPSMSQNVHNSRQPCTRAQSYSDYPSKMSTMIYTVPQSLSLREPGEEHFEIQPNQNCMKMTRCRQKLRIRIFLGGPDPGLLVGRILSGFSGGLDLNPFLIFFSWRADPSQYSSRENRIMLLLTRIRYPECRYLLELE